MNSAIDGPPVSDEPSTTASNPNPIRGLLTGVAGKLLIGTVGLVLLAQILVLPIIMADRRNAWLAGRANVGDIVAFASQSMPDHRLSEVVLPVFAKQLFILAITTETGSQAGVVLAPVTPLNGPVLTMDIPTGSPFLAVPDTFAHFTASEERFIRLRFKPQITAYDMMEVTVSERALRSVVAEQSGAIILNTLIVSILAGAIVYFMVYRIVVRPMRQISDVVVQFSKRPDTPPSDLSVHRDDEIGRVLDALGSMQQDVSAALRQRKRLADLGEAGAKISHDLRNSLSAVQMLSDGLSCSQDPHVRATAPRLERAIQRALSLAEATLKYGAGQLPQAQALTLRLKPVLEDALIEGLAGATNVQWQIECGADLAVIADPEHLHRIVVNLVRNSWKAISSRSKPANTPTIAIKAQHGDRHVSVVVEDNGPGVPDQIRRRLFLPFSQSGNDDSSGLGLAIARELARGMGGDLDLARSDASGAAFQITLRPAE